MWNAGIFLFYAFFCLCFAVYWNTHGHYMTTLFVVYTQIHRLSLNGVAALHKIPEYFTLYTKELNILGRPLFCAVLFCLS